jgi:hypothetical protein
MGEVEVLPKTEETDSIEKKPKGKKRLPKFNFSVSYDPEENTLEFGLELDLSKFFKD